MLHRYFNPFLDYFHVADFSHRSIQAKTDRIKEFQEFLSLKKIRSIKKVTYKNLIEFAADFKSPSIHITKSRVWMLRHSSQQTMDVLGLRNLIIILMLGFLGLRTSTLIAVNIEDIELTAGLLWVREKGRQVRSMVLPHCACKIIAAYLNLSGHAKGSLLTTKHNRRISPRTLQDIFRNAADCVGIDKKLHARLFRHTAATHLNKIAGIDITQHMLGHALRKNTLKYAHLNPDQYAVYMRQHPYMRKEAP